jgi:hypothetical protein
LQGRARELRIAKLLCGFVVPLLPRSLHSRQTCLPPSFLANRGALIQRQRYRKPRQEVSNCAYQTLTNRHRTTPSSVTNICMRLLALRVNGLPILRRRSQNPPTSGSWGFDSPSRHQFLCRFEKTYTFPGVSDLPPLSLSYAAAIRRGISLRRTWATGFSCSRSSVACTRRSA